jgi:hypothetical protein
MSRFCALLVSIGLLTPISAMAQEAAEVGFGVRSGQLVRMRSAEGRLLEGRLSRSSAQGPILQVEGSEVPISVAATDSLWVRGNRAMTGALIGGVVFGAGSTALGWFVCAMNNDGHGCQSTAQVLGFTALGTAVGAGLGALIGSAFGTWRLNYARPGASVTLSPASPDRVVLNVRLPL